MKGAILLLVGSLTAFPATAGLPFFIERCVDPFLAGNEVDRSGLEALDLSGIAEAEEISGPVFLDPRSDFGLFQMDGDAGPGCGASVGIDAVESAAIVDDYIAALAKRGLTSVRDCGPQAGAAERFVMVGTVRRHPARDAYLQAFLVVHLAEPLLGAHDVTLSISEIGSPFPASFPCVSEEEP